MAFEATPEHARLLISMRETASVPVDPASGAVHVVAKSGDWLTVLCWQATPEVVDLLAALTATYGVSGLALFCPRPNGLQALLQASGVQVNAYSINDALLKGQVGGKPRSTMPSADALSSTAADTEPTKRVDSQGDIA